MNNISWTDDEFAAAWLRRYSKERRFIVSASTPDKDEEDKKRIDSETSWILDVMEELEKRNPAHVWQLLLKVLELSTEDDRHALDTLAAGPLENLLRYHPTSAIEWIENEVKRNPKLKDLLLGVWRSHSTSDDIWRRVENASK